MATNWELRGDAPVALPDGSLEVSAPGLAGSLGVEDGDVARVRGAPPDPLDAAIAAQGLTEVRRLELDLAPAATRAWPVEAGAGVVSIDAPAPPAGYAPLALAVDEGGGCRWHRPSLERSARADVVRYQLPLPPAQLERGLVVKFLRKTVRMLLYPLTDPLLGPLASGFVRRWEDRNRPHRLFRVTASGAGAEHLGPVDGSDLGAWRAGRALLLLHGTFSSTDGSFSGLSNDLLGRWSETYEGRLLAFDHPSVSVDPDVNARELADRLEPLEALEVHVVGYSRGGLVARALERELRRRGSPHRVRKLLHVGVPNAGTPLATPDRFDDLLDRTTTVFHLVPGFGLGIRLAIESVVTVVKAVAHGALKDLDGLAAMDPDGAWLNELNRPHETTLTEVHAIGADFEPRRRGLLTFLKDHVADTVVDSVFGSEPNDLVVGTRGVYEENGAPGFPVPATLRHVYPAEEGVTHAGLVAAPATAALLERWLAPDPMGPAAVTEFGARVALVVGNSTYRWAPLRNPANDAHDVATQLREVGFDVMEAVDVPTRVALHDALRSFRARLQSGGTGLFYFAGHGIQVAGRNYLLPTEADVRYEDEVTDHALDMETPLRAMQAAGCRPSVVLLDCCRDNPFQRRFRSMTRGLATVVAPADAFIAYATGPGETAQDGAGRNSPFTSALLEHIRVPGLGLEALMKRIMRSVRASTSPPQIPWFSSSFDADFVFRGDLAAPSPVAAPIAPQPAAPTAAPSAPSPVPKPPPLPTTVVEPTLPPRPEDAAGPDPRRRWVGACPAYLENRARALGRGVMPTLLGHVVALPGGDEPARYMRAGQLTLEADGYYGEWWYRLSVTGLLIEGRHDVLGAAAQGIDDLTHADELDQLPSAVLRYHYKRDDASAARAEWMKWAEDRPEHLVPPEHHTAGDALMFEALALHLLGDADLARRKFRERQSAIATVAARVTIAAGHHFLFGDTRTAVEVLDRVEQEAATAQDLCNLAIARVQVQGDYDASRELLRRAASYRKAHHVPQPLRVAHTLKRLHDDDDAARELIERVEESGAHDASDPVELAFAWQEVLGEEQRARMHLTRAEDLAETTRQLLAVAGVWGLDFRDFDRGRHLLARAQKAARGDRDRTHFELVRMSMERAWAE